MASSCTMIRHAAGDLAAMAEGLTKNLKADMVYQAFRGSADCQVVLQVYEKYSFMNDSDATITVLFSENGGVQTVDIVASGTSVGIFRIDWIAADNGFMGKVVNLLLTQGFQVTQ